MLEEMNEKNRISADLLIDCGKYALKPFQGFTDLSACGIPQFFGRNHSQSLFQSEDRE